MNKQELMQRFNHPVKLGVVRILVDLYSKGIDYEPIYISDSGESVIIQLKCTPLSLRFQLCKDGTYIGKMTYYTDVQMIAFNDADVLIDLIGVYLKQFLTLVDKSPEINNSLFMLNSMIEMRHNEDT